MKLTRRRGLVAAIGGVAFTGLGGAAACVSDGPVLPATDRAIGLSREQLALVRSMLEALFPAVGPFPSAVSIGIHQRIDEEIWSQSPEVRADLKAAIDLLEHAPLFMGYFSRLSRLEPKRRSEAFLRMTRRGPDVVAQAAIGLAQMASLFYYAHPKAWPAIGYDGPWHKDEKPPESSLRYRSLMNETRPTT